MTTVRAERTLVKSPPEIWEELKDGERISRWIDEAVDGSPTSTVLARSETERSALWYHTGKDIQRAETLVEISGKGWGTHVSLTGELRLKGVFSYHKERDAADRLRTLLEETLDEMGSATRRPFSRQR